MRNGNALTTFLNRARVLCCALAIVAGAAFAATLLAIPREAYAASDVTTITQDSFSNGSCMLSVASGKNKGSFKLGENVTGRIYIVTSAELELDLNGYTLTAPVDESTDYGAIRIQSQGSTSGATITIKNGTIVQEGTTMVNAIEVIQDKANVTLENLTVSVDDADCVYQSGSGASTTIRGGSYTAKNSASYTMYVLDVEAGSVTVEQTDDQVDPTFTLSSEDGSSFVYKSSSATVTLKAGKFSDFPAGASLADGYAMFKSGATGSTWNVMTEEEASEASRASGSSTGWSVVVDGFGTVYFDSEDEAKAFAGEHDSSASPAVVARVGETYYASLKAAVAAAIAETSSDDTVTLLADTTEAISIGASKSVNIDLGGNTLTAPDSSEAISKSGYGTVNISSGTIASKASCVIVSAAAAVVTLDGVDATSTSTSAVNCITGTVNVKSGAISGTDASNGCAVAMGSDAVVNVSGGSLTGGTGIDISRGNATHLTVSGGDFGGVVNVAEYLASGKSLQYKSGRYYVVDSSSDEAVEALRTASRWVLTTSGGNKVYYADGDESQANVDKDKLSDSTLDCVYHVTFNDYEGNLVEARNYNSGEKLGELPYQGVREDYGFEGWYNGDDEATETTTVSADVAYTATWRCRGVAKIGETYYTTLLAAFTAAKSGDTVVLLQDTSGNYEVDKDAADDFTLDLNGHTLSDSDRETYVLKICGASKLTVTNGTITSKSRCITFDNAADGASLTLRDGDNGLTLSATEDDFAALNMTSGTNCTATVEGGTVTSTGHAVCSYGSGNVVTISGGSFTSGDAEKVAAVWAAQGTVNVSGGWFSNFIKNGSPASAISISGGSYGNDSDKAYLADGYVMEGPDADGRYTVVKDATVPVISGIQEGGVYEGSTSFTVADDSSVTVTAGNVTLTAGEDGAYTLSEETLAGVPEGALTVMATDAAGNSSSEEVSWYKAHDWSDWADDEDGANHSRTCARCGKVEKAAHELSWVTTAEPTYTTKGHKHQVCGVCGYTCNETDIDPLTPDAPVVTGIEEGGVYEGEVSFTVTSDLPIAVSAGNTILGVDQDEYTLSEETLADEEEGELTVTVADSVKFYYLHISWYKGHAWGAWTPTEDGDSHTRTCSHCGEVDEENHALEQKSDEDGHWQKCDVCGYETEKVAHTLVWVTDREATATEDGLRCEECSVCGYKTGNTEVIPHTGGDSGDDSDDKGGDADKKGDSSKDDAVIPQTGDVAGVVSGIAAAGAALAGIGAIRRRK